jgi:hypothetical protein
MRTLAHIASKKNPGRDVTRAGGKSFQIGNTYVIYDPRLLRNHNPI